MKSSEFLMRACLDAETLAVWVESGWLRPCMEDAGWIFSEIDVARARLIGDLKRDLGINDEGVAVVLDLLDQIHGLRGTVSVLLSAVRAQPDPLRRRILADISGSDGTGRTRGTAPHRHRPISHTRSARNE